MAKAITKTTAKISMTHDRVALTVKFVNGEVLKTATNRGSDTMSASSLPSSGKINLNPIFKFVCAPMGDVNNGAKFERLAKFFETTDSLQDVLVKIQTYKI